MACRSLSLASGARSRGQLARWRILLVVLGAWLLGPPVVLAQVVPGGSVSFTDATSAPPGGVALPGMPSELETVHYAFALNNTFQNGCFASSYAGPSSVSVDVEARTVTVDFDESMANYAPICPLVFDPVSNARIDLDALPAGDWTLDVDAVYDGPVPIFSVVPARTVAFTVVSAAPVPSFGVAALSLLTAGLVGIGIRGLARRASDMTASRGGDPI